MLRGTRTPKQHRHERINFQKNREVVSTVPESLGRGWSPTLVASLPLQSFATNTRNASPVAVNRRPLRVFAVPVARPAIRLGHVGPHLQFGHSHHHIIAVITLVCDQLCTPSGWTSYLPSGVFSAIKSATARPASITVSMTVVVS